jgi:hypothetical protein
MLTAKSGRAPRPCPSWLIWLAAFGASVAISGCSLVHRGGNASSKPAQSSSGTGSAEASPEPSPAADAAAGENAPSADSTPAQDNPDESSPGGVASDYSNNPPPGATVAITYSHKGDYLASLEVSKFNGAEILESRSIDSQRFASIVRFDGGVTVWEIKAGAGMFSKLPVIGEGDKYATKSVTYGKLPAYFKQVTPDAGPPEPLELGHYYVFAAERASGIVSYEVVKVEPDGSLDGYEAEPRAGTSYVLCCNVGSDFVQPPSPMAPGNPALP